MVQLHLSGYIVTLTTFPKHLTTRCGPVIKLQQSDENGSNLPEIEVTSSKGKNTSFPSLIPLNASWNEDPLEETGPKLKKEIK